MSADPPLPGASLPMRESNRSTKPIIAAALRQRDGLARFHETSSTTHPSSSFNSASLLFRGAADGALETGEKAVRRLSGTSSHSAWIAARCPGYRPSIYGAARHPTSRST
jgi:hypothetical protein